MPAFWAKFDAVKGLTLEPRAEAILTDFVRPRSSSAYSGESFKNISADRIVAWLPAFDPMSGEVRKLSATIKSAWIDHERAFRVTFPDYANNAQVFTMPSFFRFDGQVHDLDGRPALFFGIDGIVKYQGASTDLAVLFDHESFHLYHAQVNTSLRADNAPLGLLVWKEGLATFVSEQLNPRASRLAVLLNDSALAGTDAAGVRRIAESLIPVLGSTDPTENRRFLSAGYTGDVPARAGYLVGLLIAERLKQSATLAEMARIPASTVLRLMRRELSDMAAR